jgi:hypothetical protein
MHLPTPPSEPISADHILPFSLNLLSNQSHYQTKIFLASKFGQLLSSSLSLSPLSIREGLIGLASSHSTNTGGAQMEDKLIKFFATDFTKKPKHP